VFRADLGERTSWQQANFPKMEKPLAENEAVELRTQY
jgi:hypothetical protein